MSDQKTTQPTEQVATREVEPTRTGRIYSPRTDIYERKDAIVVVADMPGVANDGVDINVEKNVLTITGRVQDDAVKDHTLSYREYQVGDYQRTFTLSNEIDVGKIEASLKNGVLRITLPKSAEALPRKIAVKAC